MFKMHLKLNLFLVLGFSSCATLCADDAVAPVENVVKVEDLVEKVLNDSLSPANLKGGSTKIVSDLTSTFAAFVGFMFSQQLLPANVRNNPQANNLISIVASLVALRATRGLVQNLSKFIHWDPRDLAVANALLLSLKQGNVVTSDFDSIKKLLDEVAPVTVADGVTRSGVAMSDAQKIKLSQTIRSYIFAAKNHQSLVTRSKK